MDETAAPAAAPSPSNALEPQVIYPTKWELSRLREDLFLPPQRRHRFRIIRTLENRCRGHDHLRSGCANLGGIVGRYTAIDLQQKILSEKLARLGEFRQALSHHFLPAETWIHGHDQQHFDLLYVVARGFHRRRGL